MAAAERRLRVAPSTAVIAVTGIALTALYAVATSRIPLPRFFPSTERVTLDWIKMLGPGRREPAVAYLELVIGASTLYAIALIAGWRARRRLPRLVVWAFPVLFALALLLMYPPTAVDIFHSHAQARTLWIFGENPLLVPPAQTRYPIGLSWSEQPSAYGPGWSLLTLLLSPLLIWGDHHLAALIALKVISAAAFLGATLVIYRLVARTRPGWELFAVLLFAWSPFVLLRTVGNGHNDMVMLFFALLAIERAERRDWSLAIPLLATSALIKYSTALMLPPLLLYAWFQSEGRALDRLRALAPGLALAAATTVVSYAPFWAGAATFDTVRGEAAKMITSTPDLLTQLWWPQVGGIDAATLARAVTSTVFVALAVPVTWQARKGFDHLVVACFNVFFLYLVIATVWFRPWYMLWPATLIALRPTRWSIALFLAITLCNLFPDLIEQYRRDWGLRTVLTADGIPIAVQFAIPTAIWLAAVVRFRSLSLDASRPRGRPATTAANAAERHSLAL